ncbi:MAG TPA: nuclear transport factor 2 family protein [Croceibacterium sp.]|nr:nuclear transport factor 2 family protein [Croceibacterium sp.]
MRVCSAIMAAAFFASAAPAVANPALAAAEQSCTMSAREVLDEFIPLFFEQRNAKLAFETWVHPDYINHNPFAATGRDAAVNFLQPFFDANPEARYIVHRVIADGDLVAVHNEARFNPAGPPSAVVDIFRVENCKIVEHWDVVQQVPEQSANQNGMF